MSYVIALIKVACTQVAISAGSIQVHIEASKLSVTDVLCVIFAVINWKP